MIIANFFHIKSTNGLFFYGLDYLRENLELVRKVLVRPTMESQTNQALPGVEVVPCSSGRFLREAAMAWWRKDLLYTPTSHPLPGINHQWVTLHDSYPFKVGSKSLLKHRLFKLSLSLSRCQVGYINRSEAKPFVASLGVPSERMVFAPNRFPASERRTSAAPPFLEIVTVGLMGTDSAKKNYEKLFSAVRCAGLTQRLKFHVYGHDNPYFFSIKTQFPDIDMTLIISDNKNVADFMDSIDVLASASTQEGFGRPIASALLSGLRVELLDCPVFREFFNDGAHFHSDIDALVRALPLHSEAAPVAYTPPYDVVAAYIAANEHIRQLGRINRS